jgi:hypothetical protein
MIRSLIWKEWHEQAWKIAFGCVILNSYAALGFRARLVPDEMVVWHVLVIGLILLPLLAAMGLIAPERIEGSYGFLRTLPMPAWRILTIKVAMALLQCVVPIATVAALSIIVTHEREMSVANMLGLYARGLGVACVLLLWMVALSIHLPTEARVGLIGLGTLIAWLILTIGTVAMKQPATGETRDASAWGLLSPFCLLSPQLNLLLAVVVQAAIATLLCFWTMVRFKHLEGARA